MFEVKAVQKLYSDNALKHGIVQSLQGVAANSMHYMGPESQLDDVLAKLQDCYGQVVSSDNFPFWILSDVTGVK